MEGAILVLGTDECLSAHWIRPCVVGGGPAGERQDVGRRRAASAFSVAWI
jgi:hypothetical protein